MRNCKKISIPSHSTIKEAIETIDKGVMQIALVVDDDCLLGTITDGDIRRAFLNGSKLNDNIEGLYNTSPLTGRNDQSQEDLVQLALTRGIKQLPILDEDGRLIGIEYIDDYLRGPEKPNCVVLMAGGLGTRLRPLTAETPKPMLTVGSRPILETILDSFSRYGFRNFYFSVNYRAEKIREYFKDGSQYGANISYLNEKDRLGTAGALSLLPQDISEPIIVMNGDLLTNVNFDQLLNYHLLAKADATMCVREYTLQIPYGVVETEGARILGIEEKPTQNFFVNAGIYVLSPSALQLIPQESYFDMPQLFQSLVKSDRKACSFPITDYWMDIGQPNDFDQANSEYDEVFDV
ncbi:nucleotidyltransferase family protein [Desulfopila inferna]|uniref:nucleotidyltransferase family protein n=1 Tax=Desulfopila inferna TaxID=468528 RepID=UPI001963F60B|nr:nucleotidyltransferase family protein [Desulfopila inferna]MBM9603016.1 nucleotidyltransferase family protein [Desulfopila inferna]